MTIPVAPPARIERIVVDGVAKRYGSERALGAVHTELRAGSVCALLGHNGAGKSTLLAVLSTLTTPSAGRVRYYTGAGELKGAPLRRAIGLLSHATLCYGELTALENVELFASLAGLTNARQAAEAALDDVGLLRKDQTRPARTFSRGMWQRLALARALVTNPSVVLLDEPFTGLDRDAAEALAGRLGALKAIGALVVVVTHDLEAVAAVSDHVIILRRGQVVTDVKGAFSYGEMRALYASVAA